MRKSLKLEEALFAHMNKDLAALEPDLGKRVKCPICLNYFSELDIPNGNLTREHIIPGKLGGTFYTLTCKRCNNEAGSQLESHAIKMLQLKEGPENERLLRAEMFVDGNRSSAEVLWPSSPEKTVKINIIPKASNPAEVEATREAIEAGEKKINLTLKMDYIRPNAYVALARMAYLALFRLLGYRYILLENLSFFRDQLVPNGTLEPRINCLVCWLDNLSVEFPPPTTLLEVTKLTGLPTLMVILRLRISGITKFVGVHMPLEGTDPIQLIDRLNTMAKEKDGKTQFNVVFKP